MRGQRLMVAAFAAAAGCKFAPSDALVGDAPAPEVDSPPGSPGSPQDLTAVPGDMQVALAWEPPEGDVPITRYVVTTTPQSAGCTVAASPCTVSGLSNGATYTFRLTAVNATGASQPVFATALPYPGALDSTSLQLWLDAGSGTQSGALARWPDRSSYQRAATQAIAADQPTVGLVNNLPAVSFDGAGDYMVTPAFTSPSTTYSIFVTFVDRDPSLIANHVSVLYATRACGVYPTGGPGFTGWGYNTYGPYTTTRTPGVESPDADANAAGTNGAGLTTVPTNGSVGPMTTITQGTWSMLVQQIAIPSSETTMPLYLGAQPTLCAHGNVSIGEVVVISGLAVASKDFDAIEGYLEQRWGIPLTSGG